MCQQHWDRDDYPHSPVMLSLALVVLKDKLAVIGLVCSLQSLVVGPLQHWYVHVASNSIICVKQCCSLSSNFLSFCGDVSVHAVMDYSGCGHWWMVARHNGHYCDARYSDRAFRRHPASISYVCFVLAVYPLSLDMINPIIYIYINIWLLFCIRISQGGQWALTQMLHFPPVSFYAVARCLSVHLSVHLSHVGILSKWLNISSNFFHCQVATLF